MIVVVVAGVATEYVRFTRCAECGKAIGDQVGKPDFGYWRHVVDDNSHHPKIPTFVTDLADSRYGRPTYPIPANRNAPILVPYVWQHIAKRWPSSTPFKQVAKVGEEAGEAMGAAIKHDEGRKTEQDVRNELADTIIAAIGALQARGADAAQTVFDRWVEVSNR